MHIAIIGAGISGLMSALELAEQGCSVDIFDQQQAGQAASWAGGGILSPMYPWRYAPEVNQLAQYGKPLYHAWNEKLLPITGIDFQIHDTGMLIFDQDDFEIGLNYATRYQEPMQHCEQLNRVQLQQVNPHISAQFQHAIYFPHLSNVRNPRLLQSLICYLKQHPAVRFFEHCPVEKLMIQNKKVLGIETEDGQKFNADQVVISSGAWSQHWAHQLQCNIPVHPVQGQMLLFKAPENWLPTMCMNRVMYLIPRQDGHIVCGSSMADTGFSTMVDEQTQQDILTACLEMVPELEQFPIVKRWAGLRPSSPHGIPYIGAMPELENLWANFGHFRNGLCMGAGSARLLRQLILGQETLVDPIAYSPRQLKQSSILV
ncbi:glycine oxidase ThiO [Acinetobacter colistiniresistens]|uniref:Glycine oxidase ThiO n=1 Tax=Acinetobacter colistiniresistens TaxID=280145 RepID=S3T836_9GAMM|nr:glycine oxidase ThiO [Acinetobacter colistiniresistens]EPG37068.1 glycine oxidase ThiO [Acinetobacter colistiniresistens]TVT82726.1 glycine oxidase ThiO [Acinetobacter colistiniresistens]